MKISALAILFCFMLCGGMLAYSTQKAEKNPTTNLSVVYSDSHKPITITRQQQEDYRVPFLSPEIQNILFLQEHAQVVQPKRGFFIDLDEQSAQLIGQETILIIPINESGDNSDIWYDYNKDITMQVYPMEGSEMIYYTKDDGLLTTYQKDKSDFLKRFWSNPLPTDTFSVQMNIQPLDFQYTPLIIEQFNNNTKIVREGTMYASTTEGCFSSPIYDQTTVSELAREQLRYLSNCNFTIPDEDATQAEWKQWYKSLPQPIVDEPQINVTLWDTPWSMSSWVTIDGTSFLQADDTGFIYNITPDSTFILNTQEQTLARLGAKDIALKNMKWRKAVSTSDANANNWLAKNEEHISTSQYLKLKNGDVLIITVESTRFQQKAVIYRMSKDGQISKGTSFFSTIPLESTSDNGILIQKIFESDGKYYVILQVEDTNYWHVFDDSMLQ